MSEHLKLLNNSLITHYIEVPYYNEERRVRVLLPEGYDTNMDHAYPVLYMHDGQNLFLPHESYAGDTWQVAEAVTQTEGIPDLIVVGIDNYSEKRLDEYSPWPIDTNHPDADKNYGGDGKLYGEWLVKTVKPLIDREYRTLTQPENTIVAGSSMGGLITAYLGSAYPSIFGVLGVFSLASWFNEKEFLHYIKENPINDFAKVYIQVGTNEGNLGDEEFVADQINVNQLYIDVSKRYHQTLVQAKSPTQKTRLYVYPEEGHQEKYWAKHFPDFLKFAFENI